MNESTFRKMSYLIQGRRLSKIGNLLKQNSSKNIPFITRTLSVDEDVEE